MTTKNSAKFHVKECEVLFNVVLLNSHKFHLVKNNLIQVKSPLQVYFTETSGVEISEYYWEGL